LAGDIDLALSLHRRAEEMVDALDDPVVATRLDALSSLAGAELYLDLFDRSARHGERCIALSRQFGETSELPMSANIVGTSSWVIGEMQRSAEVLDDAIDAARLIGNPASLSWVLFNRAYSALEAGDVETASRLSDESMKLTEQFDAGLISAYAGAVSAMTLMELGQPDTALRRLLDASGGDDLTLMPGSWRPTHFELLTRCHLGVGNLDKAKRAAGKARGEAKGFRLPLPTLMADLAEADVALAENRWDTALKLASSASEHAVAIGARPYLARSNALAGVALVGLEREEDATEHFETAARIYDELGAKRYRDQVNSRLRALGRPAYRRTRRGLSTLGVDALTGREMEVAELIHDRRTNREIADMLFLSTKTVETHIRNIFNKLGVSSRVEIARALDQNRESLNAQAAR
jgi:ATP/maltotriose-dependent transcriptional regulator MalT